MKSMIFAMIVAVSTVAHADVASVSNVILAADNETCVVILKSTAMTYRKGSYGAIRLVNGPVQVRQESQSFGGLHIFGKGFDYRDLATSSGGGNELWIDTDEGQIGVNYLKRVDQCPFDISKAAQL